MEDLLESASAGKAPPTTGIRRFTGQRAVVTGAATGIGYATALRLAREGALVGVLDLSASDAKSAAQTIVEDHDVQSAGGSARGLCADVALGPTVEAALQSFVGETGGLEVLVNNAGITRDELFFRMRRTDWNAVLETNLTGVFVCAQEAQRYMVSARYGRIVNLSSRAALGNRGQANYSAAKAGVRGLTATLAIELGPFNITVNGVAPGFIRTSMTDATARRQERDPAEYRAEIAQRTPLRRVGQPDEVAAAIAFLASSEASYISGQTLGIDGGAR